MDDQTGEPTAPQDTRGPDRARTLLRAIAAVVVANLVLRSARIAYAWRTGSEADVPIANFVIGAGVATALWTAHPLMVAIVRGVALAGAAVTATLAVLFLVPAVGISFAGAAGEWPSRIIAATVFLGGAAALLWVGVRMPRSGPAGGDPPGSAESNVSS